MFFDRVILNCVLYHGRSVPTQKNRVNNDKECTPIHIVNTLMYYIGTKFEPKLTMAKIQ